MRNSYLNGLKTNGGLYIIFTRETSVVASCLFVVVFFLHTNPLLKRGLRYEYLHI